MRRWGDDAKIAAAAKRLPVWVLYRLRQRAKEDGIRSWRWIEMLAGYIDNHNSYIDNYNRRIAGNARVARRPQRADGYTVGHPCRDGEPVVWDDQTVEAATAFDATLADIAACRATLGGRRET